MGSVKDSSDSASIAERHHRGCEMAGDERRPPPAPNSGQSKADAPRGVSPFALLVRS